MRPERAASSGATRAAVVVALLVPAALLIGLGGRGALFGAVLGLVHLLAARTGGRFAAGPIVQAAAGVLAGAAGVGAFVGVSRASGHSPAFGLLVCVGLSTIAGSRLWFRVGRAGLAVTLGFGLVALMGLARSTDRWSFGVAVAGYLFAAILANLLADPATPPLSRDRRGALAPLALALGIAAVVLAGLGWTLPEAEPAVSRALRPLLAGADEASRSGFGHGDVRLGHLTEILNSDEVALRVEGEGVAYLRGQVYVDYLNGLWHARDMKRSAAAVVMGRRLVLGAGATTARVAIESEPEVGRVLFAPYEALEISDAPDDSSVDAFGVVNVHADQATDRHRYVVGLGADARRRNVAAPLPDRDLQLPVHAEARLRAIASAWTRGVEGDAARIEALRARLAGDFAYSLTPPRVPGGDEPVLHFLDAARAGHCEYFASALALLSRAVGVPARFVSGFRVYEYNAVGGYYVVRQRDAHAWTEVWLDGAWRTVDATPSGALDAERPPVLGGFGARWDQVKRWLVRSWERLANLSALELATGLTAAAALTLFWLWVRRRQQSRAALPSAEGPFAALARLEAHLASTRRLERPPHRPLGAFAADLRASALPVAADLVEACDRALYGRGDPGTVERAVDQYVSGPPEVSS